MPNNDFEKANVLHNFLSNFDVTPEMRESLIAQIKDPQVSENLERIFAGLKVEDSYYIVTSPLPWVKNIHPLDQKQERKHKENYQVPDYSLLIENSQKVDFPLLVDVKSAKGQKETCQLPAALIPTLRNYAQVNNKPILIAIFWEKYHYWTHNTLEHFDNKRKISFADAFANDLSHILSDYLFLFTRNFYRKSYFSDTPDENLPRHQKYGTVISSYLGFELDKLETLEHVESAIIDAAFKMKEVEIGTDSKGKYLIDKFELPEGCLGTYIKTTSWIRKLHEYIGIPFDERRSIKNGEKSTEVLSAEIIRKLIVEVAKRLKGEAQYPEPTDKNPTTDKLYELAYKDTDVHQRYLSSYSEDDIKKVVF